MNKFEQFLVENNVFDRYMIELFMEDWERGTDVDYTKWNYSSEFMSAFSWHDTPQGHAFWSKLNTKWVKVKYE